MSRAVLQITKTGLQSSLQNGGRKGVARWGFPKSGAMDERLLLLGNHLVGNPPHQTAIECTMQGGSFTFLDNAVCAVTAIDAEISLNGKPAPLYQTLHINRGDTLSIGRITEGNFAYLAIHGILMPQSDEQRNLPAQPGDLCGWKLRKNDVLAVASEAIHHKHFHSTPEYQRPVLSPGKHVIRVLKGPEFSRVEIDDFAQLTFTLSNQMNRMGYRAETSGLQSRSYDIPSSPTLPGTVQLTGSDSVIMLMKDAQVTGGYPRIAQVIEADLPRLAQLRPGREISFRVIDLHEALELRRWKV